jgi:hypothetical protein
MTAPAPEGPWSEAACIYQATPIGAGVYAAAPHPYFDESGKTLIVTFTNNPNLIQSIKVVSFLVAPGVRMADISQTFA